MQINNFNAQFLKLQMTQQLLEAINNLEQGDVVKGRFLGMNQKNEAQIKLLNGETVQAKLKGDVALPKGKLIDFTVDTVKDGKITLKPHLSQVKTNKSISHQMMQMLELEDSPQNRQLMEVLLNNKVQIKKPYVQQVQRELEGIEQNKFKLLDFMLKGQIAVDKDKISLIKGYEGSERKLTHVLNDFSEKFPKALESAFKKEFSEKGDTTHVTKLIEVVDEKGTLSKEVTELMKSLNNIEKAHMQGKFDKIDGFKKMELPDKMLLLDQLTKESFKPIRKEVQERLSKLFFIDPRETFHKEGIQKVYQNINEKMNDMLEQISHGQNEIFDETKEQIQSIREHLHLINEMNQQYDFIHLPFQFRNGYLEGDLFCLKEQSNKTKNGEKVKTFLLSLSTANIGHLEIYSKLYNKSIECQFIVENKDIKKYITSSLKKLQDKLMDKGYHFEQLNVKVIDEVLDFTDKMKKTRDVPSSKPLNFDEMVSIDMKV